jgi:hypothetical protein
VERGVGGIPVHDGLSWAAIATVADAWVRQWRRYWVARQVEAAAKAPATAAHTGGG